MNETGVYVSRLRSNVTREELKQHFSNPTNGGSYIKSVLYPLKNGDAVIFFDASTSTREITQHEHVIQRKRAKVKPLPQQMFCKVTVELDIEAVTMLDQNSSHLDHLQLVGELDVNFDTDKMTYVLVGNWYQMEWALEYLQRTAKEENAIACGGGNGSENIRDADLFRELDGSTSSSTTSDEALFDEEVVELNEASAMRNDIGAPYQRLQNSARTSSHKQQDTEEVASNRPMVSLPSNIPTHLQSPLSRGGGEDTKVSSLLGNPASGQGVNYDELFREDSDDTDEELEEVRRMFQHEEGFDIPPHHRFDRLSDHGMFDFLPRRSSPPLSMEPPRPSECFIHGAATNPEPDKGIELRHSDFGNMPLTYEFDVKWLHINVLLGDLLKERSDALVSPATKDLNNSYGVSAIISRMAGRPMLEECRDLVRSTGARNIGEVVHTCAGGALDKRISFILHVITPRWREDEEESTTHILTCAYLNCLKVANSKLWLRSLSIPLLGSGGLGIPLDVSVQAFYDAVALHVSDTNQPKHLKEIRMLSNIQDNACAIIVVMRSLAELDHEELSKAAMDRYMDRSVKYSYKATDFWKDESAKSKKSPNLRRHGNRMKNEERQSLNEEKPDIQMSGGQVGRHNLGYHRNDGDFSEESLDLTEETDNFSLDQQKSADNLTNLRVNLRQDDTAPFVDANTHEMTASYHRDRFVENSDDFRETYGSEEDLNLNKMVNEQDDLSDLQNQLNALTVAQQRPAVKSKKKHGKKKVNTDTDVNDLQNRLNALTMSKQMTHTQQGMANQEWHEDDSDLENQLREVPGVKYDETSHQKNHREERGNSSIRQMLLHQADTEDHGGARMDEVDGLFSTEQRRPFGNAQTRETLQDSSEDESL